MTKSPVRHKLTAVREVLLNSQTVKFSAVMIVREYQMGPNLTLLQTTEAFIKKKYPRNKATPDP